MHFLNLNIFSIIFFVFVTLFLFFLFFSFYKNQKILKKNNYFFLVSKFFYLKIFFLFLSFFCIFLSIFWIKYISGQDLERKWIDVVFILDVSKSMNVADIKGNNGLSYTRLDFSKKAISDFILNNVNNRYWLIIFSWEAKSVLPLTSDTDLFLTFLESVNYKNFEKQWSSFKEAFKLSSDRIISSDDFSKFIVLFSDWGEQDDDINIKNYIDKKSSYFIVWVWSENWWKIIVWEDVFWNLNYQKYKWDYVISSLNEENLKYLAMNSNWEYKKLDKISDLEKIKSSISSLEKKVFYLNSDYHLKSISRFLSFLSFIFFCLFLIFYILDEKNYVK